ncbi:hypothetical protein [uncultured Hyphomicrobium sp.]|uniref:hypothetical protein n=1 Tax=uncultured Hyphomicrobium sp. TaxID=194373 RepID=UPI0025EFE1BC|nr:hypothetical protein [uncultured Hyphomicrobium sp.]
MNAHAPEPDSPQLAKLLFAIGLLYANPVTQARETAAHRELYDFLRRTQGKVAADHTAEQIAAYYRDRRWQPELWDAYKRSTLRARRVNMEDRHG